MSANDSVIFSIRLQPAAKKDEFCGWMEDGTLKIRVKGKPVEGKANENLVAFLSKSLDIPRTSIQITAGERSKNKRIKVTGLNAQELNKHIRKLIDQEP